jgi:glycosyltransferase involved in cell wall biosynthesis
MRPALLFLGHNLPHPPDVGLAIRSYHLLRSLAGAFEVTALCFYRWRGRAALPTVADSVGELSRFGEIEAFPIPQEHSRLRMAGDHFRSLSHRTAYTHFTYASHAYERRLREVLRSRRFACAYVDNIDLARYMPLLEGLPVVVGHQNAEADLLRRRSQIERPRWLRPYLALQARLLARVEQRWCERVALNVTCSDEDRSLLSESAPRGRFLVVPNGADVDFYRPEPGAEEGLVFVGGTTWFPNRDALGYWVREILPLLRGAGETARVTWVGRVTDDERRALGRVPGLMLTGYVQDVRSYVRDAACYVVPLRVGGGTRLKIVEAWAMGKAVVSSPIGCQGLRAADGANIVIRESPAAFAHGVTSVLHDQALRRRLGRAARHTAVEHYSWARIGDAFVAELKRLASASVDSTLTQSRDES